MTDDRILLELKSISKSFGPTAVLEGIELAVRDGEFITILGPSGSGKTTILRMIGGFTQPSGGEILLEGRDITGLPINRRPFNTVFQDYALLPDMTVAGNVSYGLMVRGRPRREIARKVSEALDLVQLGPWQIAIPPSSLAGSASAWRWPAPSSASRRPPGDRSGKESAESSRPAPAKRRPCDLTRRSGTRAT